MEEKTQNSGHVVNRKKLKDLLEHVDPALKIEPDVESILLDLSDDFINDLVRSACALSKHRNSETLEIVDLALVLESSFGIRVPGFSDDFNGGTGNIGGGAAGGGGGGGKSVKKGGNGHGGRIGLVRRAVAADLAEKEKEKNLRKQSGRI